MKQFLLPFFGLLLLVGCEKEQLSPVEQGQDPTALEFRSEDPDCGQPACVAVTGLIADVTALIAAADIGFGPGQSILSQLEGIKKKLEKGQTAEAQAKLADLITHLEALAADGTVETTIITDLIAKVTAADCQIDSSGADCFPYRTVTLLDGKTWMAEDLNFEVADSWCYDDDPNNCTTYGRLYTWQAARTACTSLGTGWRLPTKMDWDEMIKSYDPNFLGDWPATYTGYDILTPGGDSGFDAQLGGYRSIYGVFGGLGSISYYWSATKEDNAYGTWYWHYQFDSDEEALDRDVFTSPGHGVSVRCVRN